MPAEATRESPEVIKYWAEADARTHFFFHHAYANSRNYRATSRQQIPRYYPGVMQHSKRISRGSYVFFFFQKLLKTRKIYEIRGSTGRLQEHSLLNSSFEFRHSLHHLLYRISLAVSPSVTLPANNGHDTFLAFARE